MNQYVVLAHQEMALCKSVLLAERTPRKYEKPERAGEALEDKYSFWNLRKDNVEKKNSISKAQY